MGGGPGDREEGSCRETDKLAALCGALGSVPVCIVCPIFFFFVLIRVKRKEIGQANRHKAYKTSGTSSVEKMEDGFKRKLR